MPLFFSYILDYLGIKEHKVFKLLMDQYREKKMEKERTEREQRERHTERDRERITEKKEVKPGKVYTGVP